MICECVLRVYAGKGALLLAWNWLLRRRGVLVRSVHTHTLVLFTKVETGHLNEPHPNPPFNPGARLSKPRNPGESFQKEEHFKSENLATYGVTLSKVIICESPPETVPNHSVWYFRGSNEGSAVVSDGIIQKDGENSSALEHGRSHQCWKRYYSSQTGAHTE